MMPIVTRADLDHYVVLDKSADNFYAVKGENANYHRFLETMRQAFKGKSLTGSCPLSIRHEIQAQHSYRASERGVRDRENIRMRSLFSATIGFALTLSARIIRVALRTIFIIPSLLLSLYQQNKYSVKGLVKEDAKRFRNEWIDLGMTFLAVPIGLINTVYPDAIKLDWARDYYIARIASVETKNAELDRAITAYKATKESDRATYETTVNNLR